MLHRSKAKKEYYCKDCHYHMLADKIIASIKNTKKRNLEAQRLAYYHRFLGHEVIFVKYPHRTI